ncbi:Flp family type IVb pilin [Devosia sp. 2618]|uniref:Flp family type IVb pilin n=1 Tax=Devosia sp. 2618 TaxID=3156454 RepID=UPI0033912426
MLGCKLRGFLADESGATAIEYGLLAALVAVAAIGSFTILGEHVVGLLDGGAGSAGRVIAEQTTKMH